MSSHRKSRLRHRALIALGVVPPIVFLAAIPWLKQQPDSLVFLFAGIASTLAVVAGFSFSVLADRQMDEWQRSNARFSNQWGWLAGISLVALLLALPPIHDLIVSIVSWAATTLAHAPTPDREVALLTFTFGFMAAVLAQIVCTVLLSIGWFSWKSRPARDPS